MFFNIINGTSDDDEIFSTDVGSLIFAKGGNDIVHGGAGDDIIFGEGGEDTLLGGAGDDYMRGNEGADYLFGDVGDDILSGGEGDDVLEGGDGDDVYILSQDDGDENDDVIEQANEGEDEVQTDLGSYALTDYVENLTYTGAEDFWGEGNDLDNVITGGSGADVLDGGDGNDTLIGQDGDDTLWGGLGQDEMQGGAGDDAYFVDNKFDAVIEDEDEGHDTVGTSLNDYELTGNVEDLYFAGSGDFHGEGNSLDNAIFGGDDNDVLDGAAGADSLFGGAGNDVYIVDNFDDAVYEEDGQGVDTVETTVSSTKWDAAGNGTANKLADNVENLTYTGHENFVGVGNELDNIITGGQRNDMLLGLSGNDALNGGSGNDMLFGGLGDDRLYGGAGADLLVGQDGVDRLEGGAGNDSYVLLDGWDNSDVIAEKVHAGVDEVLTNLEHYALGDNVENLTFINIETPPAFSDDGELALLTNQASLTINPAGLDHIGVGNDLANIITGGSGNDTLYGNGGSDTLDGGAGNDVLDGGSGNDTMAGGAGDDIYYVDRSGDKVVEDAGEGHDTVYSSYSSCTLSSNVEDLHYTGTRSFTGTGNKLDNEIWGGDAKDTLKGLEGDDILHGGAGDDKLNGGAGDDKLYGDSGDDTMNGGNGSDDYWVDSAGDKVLETSSSAAGGVDTVHASVDYTLSGSSYVENLILEDGATEGVGNGLDNSISVDDGNSANCQLRGGAGNDTLTGGSEADHLFGGAGDDTLNGGAGNDTLTGDAGKDTFVFNADFGNDTVTDFDTGTATDHDTLNVESVFTDFDDVLFHSSVVDGQVVITADSGDTITLANVSNVSDLQSWDFAF
jgi:Ca2+-binding RTX toxin-like protein